MAALLQTRQARADLVDIWLYIAQDSIEPADQWADKLEQACETLADTPELGWLRNELRPEVRSLAFGAYVIFCRKSGGFVQILRVLHVARDIQNLF